MKLDSSFIIRLLALFGIICAILGAVLSPIVLLTYPFVAVAIGLLVWLVFDVFPAPPQTISLSVVQTRVIDVIIFMGITLNVILAYAATPGVHRLFYFSAIVIAAVIAGRIVIGQPDPIICLSQIILLGIAVRAGLYFSYPVYGQDLFHPGLAEYIVQNGHLASADASYYHWYPMSHIAGGAISLIGDFSGRRGFFIAGSVSQVLAYSALYLLTFEVGLNTRGRLLSVLVPVISGATVEMGSEVFAQTFSGGLFVLLVWLFVRQRSGRREILCFVILSLVAFFTHHTIFFLLIGLVCVTFISKLLLTLFSRIQQSGTLQVDSIISPFSPIAIVGVIFICGLYYWIITGYFNYQFNRLVSIFSVTQSTGTEITESAASGEIVTTPTVVFFDGVLAPVAQWAAPMLALILIVTISGMVLLKELFDELHFEIRYAQFSIAAVVFFGGFSVVYAIGGSGPVTRFFAAITVLTAPLIALATITAQKDIGLKQLFLALFLILNLSTAGLLNPSVALPDRTDDSFSPVASEQDVAAAQFAVEYTRNYTSDRYLFNVIGWRLLIRDYEPSNPVLHHSFPWVIDGYEGAIKEGRPFVHREYFESYFGITPKGSILYDNGNVKIVSNSTA